MGTCSTCLIQTLLLVDSRKRQTSSRQVSVSSPAQQLAQVRLFSHSLNSLSMHSDTALWYQIGKDLAFQGSERAFLAQVTVQLNLLSPISSATFDSKKKLPTTGIYTRSFRYSSLRVPLVGTLLIDPSQLITRGSRDSTAQGRYLARKAVVRQARTVRVRQATTLIMLQLIIAVAPSSINTWRVGSVLSGEGKTRMGISYHQMYKGQVYNAAGWDGSEASPSRETTRRLDRRIKQNMGLADRSRHSNQSNSMRMKRTQMSGDRASISRDRQLNSHQTSGMTADPFNDSLRRVPRRMGSVLSLSRRRGQDSTRLPAAGSRSGKNIVQNLYMLTNNVPQYPEKRHLNPHPSQEQESRYSQRHSRNQYERQEPYPQYSEQRVERYPERSPNRIQDRSQDRYRQDPYANRSPTPTRGSVLRSRRSKQSNGGRGDRANVSREKGYKHVGSNRDVNRGHPDTQIRKLEQKYMQNIYQLNSPKSRGNGDPRGDRGRGYKEPDGNYQGAERGKDRESRRDRNSKKVDSRNSPRVHDPYTSPRPHDPYSPRGPHGRDRNQQQRRPYPDDRGRPYPENKNYPSREDRGYQDRLERHYVDQDDGYEQEWEERDRYRNQRGSREDPYRDKRDGYRRGDSRRKMQSGNSDKNNPYYYQDQNPSTTVGVKTLPEVSKYDSISDVPINSIGSYKEMPKHNIVEQLPAKRSVKLDRPKGRPVRGQKEKYQDQRQLGYEESNIDERWQKNNIKLEDRPREQWDKKKEKILEDSVKPGALPSGSMFLPVESKRFEPRQWAQQTLQKIILHLQNLNLIADYTKDFKKMYENVQPWQELIFLTYKKFYIERIKVTNVLRSPSTQTSDESASSLQMQQNPFTLPYSKISEEEMTKFRQTKECFALLIELDGQNTKIRNALRSLYNLYIEKSGEHVNMLDCDNFSDQIQKMMIDELDGIAENLSDVDLVTPTRMRMGKIIKVGLLVAFLNGKYVRNFPQILVHEDMIKVGKRQTLREDSVSHLFLNEFKHVLSS